jgi:hypothetical protein
MRTRHIDRPSNALRLSGSSCSFEPLSEQAFFEVARKRYAVQFPFASTSAPVLGRTPYTSLTSMHWR